jgi:hypothetical protein
MRILEAFFTTNIPGSESMPVTLKITGLSRNTLIANDTNVVIIENGSLKQCGCVCMGCKEQEPDMDKWHAVLKMEMKIRFISKDLKCI